MDQVAERNRILIVDESLQDALAAVVDAVNRFGFQAALEPLESLESLVDARVDDG